MKTKTSNICECGHIGIHHKEWNAPTGTILTYCRMILHNGKPCSCKKFEARKSCGKRFIVRDLLSRRNRDGSNRYSSPRKATCGEYGTNNAFIDYCEDCQTKLPQKKQEEEIRE
jgi:hypothetical protein